MAANESSRTIAACLFQPSIVTPAPNTFGNVGIKNIKRITGVPAGGWLIELDQPLTAAYYSVKVLPRTDLQVTPVVKEESGTGNLEVRTYNATGALADADFWFEVTQPVAALHEPQRFA